MIKHSFYFLFAFVAGCVITLVARTAHYNQHTTQDAHSSVSEVAPMVDNTTHDTPLPRANHTNASATEMQVMKTVNSICPICGMEVDPELPTATYQGKTIGFGCTTCPGKFAANPERYGPSALRNETVRN